MAGYTHAPADGPVFRALQPVLYAGEDGVGYSGLGAIYLLYAGGGIVGIWSIGYSLGGNDGYSIYSMHGGICMYTLVETAHEQHAKSEMRGEWDKQGRV